MSGAGARLVWTLAIASMAIAGRAEPQGSGQSGPAGRAPATGTGVIVGQTIDALTGRPVAGALVALRATPGNLDTLGPGDPVPMDQIMSLDFGNLFAGVHQALTDAQGRFAFTDLPRGSFSLTATKPGWLGGGYNQRRPDSSGTPIVLAENERIGSLTLQLWKNGALAGTVVDEIGEPVVGTTVRALRRTWLAGRPQYSFDGAGQTDDRGFYRISALRPGDYVVVITQTPVTTPAAGSAPVDLMAFRNLAASNSQGMDPNAFVARMSALAGAAGGAGIRVGDWTLQTSSVGSRLIPPIVKADGRMLAYHTTFYPGATTASQAVSVTLGAGEERPSLDVQLRAGAVVRISGSVVGPEGPLGNTTLRLVPAGVEELSSESGFEAATATSNPGGLFTFLAVPAGQYTLKVLRTPPQAAPVPGSATNPSVGVIQNASGGMTMSMGSFSMNMIMPAPPPIPAEPTLWANVALTVGDADVDGVSVLLKPGFRITGRVEFEGGTARPSFDQLRRIPISLDRAEAGSGGATPFAGLGQSQNGQFDASGQFTTYGLVPGRYFVRVPFSIGDWTLKSAMLGGKDLADSPVEIDSSDVSGVVLTFSDRATELSGVVRNAQGQIDADASVVVFPPGPETWLDFGSAPRRLRVARTTRDGQYRIARLPAGDYLIAAVEGDTGGEWQNPAFLRSLAAAATRISVGDGEKKAQDLRIVR